jgi:hypothetical protein
MWNDFKSLSLSILVTRILMTALVISVFFLPYLGRMYLSERDMSLALFPKLIIPLYFCIIPAAIALFCLDRLLARIKKDEVFVPGNTQAIRVISWCCFAVGLISGIASFFYLPYIFVMIIVLFCGLIMRVVKNVFSKAVSIKNENDYTI